MWETLKSEIDESVNFILKTAPGMIECRYVRRCEDYFIIYLSSQTGCNKACRMCHLTQSGQTAYKDVTLDQYIEQVNTVMEYYDTQPTANRVHFNFMARGEVFANSHISTPYYMQKLLSRLADSAHQGYDRGNKQIPPKFKFSTIMPFEMENKSLPELFGPYSPDIYYSLYSVNPDFRKKWLPKSLPVEESLVILKDYQEHSHKIIKLHWAFIEGENDSYDDVYSICSAIKKAKLRVDFNIVRYNPFSELQGNEPDEEHINDLAQVFRDVFLESNVNIVPRVGYDVKGSCGMFYNSKEKNLVSLI